MPDSNITLTPNLHLARLPANYRVWGQIMNDNLTMLDAAVSGFIVYDNWRGAWSNSTHYALGDTVVDLVTAVIWTAQVDHTSASIPTTFTQEQINHPTYWTLANAPAVKRGAWMPNTPYSVNDFVLANGTKYSMCLVQHVSSSSFDADLALGFWSVLIDFTTVGAQVPVGSVPPGLPITNSMWWNSDLGQLFVWYNDGNSTQWVPASPAAVAVLAGSTFTLEAFGGGTTMTAAQNVAAFNACFAAMPRAGGIIQLGPGNYNLNATITTPTSAIIINGVGGYPINSANSGSELTFLNTTGHGLVWQASGGGIHNVGFSGNSTMGLNTGLLVINGGAKSNEFTRLFVAAGNCNLWLQNVLRIKFYDCVFSGVTGNESVLFNGIDDTQMPNEVGFYECISSPKSNTGVAWCIDGQVQSIEMHASGAGDGAGFAGRHALWVTRRDGIVEPAGTGMPAYSGTGRLQFLRWFGRGFENATGDPTVASHGDAVRIDVGVHVAFNGVYIASDGQGNGILQNAAFEDALQINNCYIRGNGRDAIHLKAGWASIHGNHIVNDARLSSSSFNATITGIVNNGAGFCRVTYTPNANWTVRVGDNVSATGVVGTVEANTVHLVTAVNSSTSFDTNVAFVNAYVSGGTFFLYCGAIRFESTAQRSYVGPNMIGTAGSGTNNMQYGVRVEGSGDIRTAFATHMSPAGTPLVQFIPTATVTGSNLSQRTEGKSIQYFPVNAAPAVAYTMFRPVLPDGKHAIYGYRIAGAVGGASVRAAARNAGGGATYVESGSVTSTALTFGFVETIFSAPLLITIAPGLTTGHDMIGYRITAVGGETSLEVALLMMRIT